MRKGSAPPGVILTQAISYDQTGGNNEWEAKDGFEAAIWCTKEGEIRIRSFFVQIEGVC